MPWNLFGKSRLPGPGFDAALADAFARLGWRVVSISEEQAVISDGKESRTMNLYNIRPAWNNGSAEDREQLLGHFVRTATAPSQSEEIKFEQARPRLMPRIGPPMELKENPPAQVWLVPGKLQANIVIDSEDSMAYVHESTLRAWGKTAEELLPVALDNLRRQSSPDRWDPIGEVAGLTAYNILEDYTAARALIIGDLARPWPQAGVVLGIPSKTFLFCVRLDSVAAVEAINALVAMSYGIYQREGWTLLPQPVWFDGTQWEIIETWVDRGSVNVAPSQRFTAALNRLAGG